MKYTYIRYPNAPLLMVEADSILVADALFLDHQAQQGPVQPIQLQANVGCVPGCPINAGWYSPGVTEKP